MPQTDPPDEAVVHRRSRLALIVACAVDEHVHLIGSPTVCLKA
jgi:hypothetical protein